jgi:predicted permease
MRDGGRGTTAGRARLRFRAGLMTGQVALALMLLAGSGLLVRSWLNVRAASPGFGADNALFFEVGLSSQDYPDRERAVQFHSDVAARISALPGVDNVAYATCLPLDGYCWGESVLPDGDVDAERVVVSMRRVSPAFFDALELPLVSGRPFTSGAPVDEVVLSEEAARRLFPEGGAVGRRIGYGSASDAQWFPVVGVAADAATTSVMEDSPEPVFYLPIRDNRVQTVGLHRMSFIVRTAGDPAALAPAVRSVIHDIDARTAVARVRTLADVLAADRAQIALATVLLVLAAGVALLLGALGIYAVFAYVVGRRTAEFGLRLALGARASHVFRIVFRQAGIITLSGFVLGLAGAAVLTRSLATLLFGVQPLDAGVFGLASVILLAIACMAAFLPARRASRLHPVEALRLD